MGKPRPAWKPTSALGSLTPPAEGVVIIALTIQSVGNCVQDLIFGGKFWLECRLVRCHPSPLADHAENRPPVIRSHPHRRCADRGGRRPLADLRERLRRTRWPAPETGQDWP